jgi:hypothetical protein
MTKEGEGTGALMEDHPEPRPLGITVHRERPVEVRQMEDGGSGECALEGIEGCGCLRSPDKALLPKQLGEGRCNRVIVLDEPLIVSSEPDKATQATH